MLAVYVKSSMCFVLVGPLPTLLRSVYYEFSQLPSWWFAIGKWLGSSYINILGSGSPVVLKT